MTGASGLVGSNLVEHLLGLGQMVVWLDDLALATGTTSATCGRPLVIRDGRAEHRPAVAAEPLYGAFRPGDVRHSLADISKARARLGYSPTVRATEGLRQVLPWYVEAERGRPIGHAAPQLAGSDRPAAVPTAQRTPAPPSAGD